MAAILTQACSRARGCLPACHLARALGATPTSTARRKLAVVLSGCGVYDGSEVHEASAILVHLSAQLDGGQVDMFAPDIQQMHVIDHVRGEPASGETRNLLVESARIARGNVSSLSNLSSNDYDAILFPGGFGAAKNLSTFAVDGAGMKVNEDVERVLKEFHTEKKPIGLCCISPVLAAKVFPGVTVTVGNDEDPAAQAIVAMGSKHIQKPVTESYTDEENKVVTTPAFMFEAPFHHIFIGIGSMVREVLKLVNN